MDRLGIRGTDEFETLITDYLKSGLLGRTAIAKIIEKYISEEMEHSARTRTKDFLQRCIWNPELTESELLKQLDALLPDAHMLDMFTATSLHDQAMELDGGENIAKEIINQWIKGFRQRHPPGQEFELDSDFNLLNRPLHPEIEAELNAMQARQPSSMTILDVCRRMSKKESWGSREESFMKSVTPNDYKDAIKTASGQDLKLLLLQSMNFLKNKKIYDVHFGGAIQSFEDGCRAIVQDGENSRLCRLLRDLFSKSGIELDPTATPQPN